MADEEEPTRLVVHLRDGSKSIFRQPDVDFTMLEYESLLVHKRLETAARAKDIPTSAIYGYFLRDVYSHVTRELA